MLDPGVNCTQILALAKVNRWSNFNHNFITNKEKVSTQHLKAKISLKKEALQIPPPPTNSLYDPEHCEVGLTWYSEFTNYIRAHGGQVGNIMLHSLHTHSSRVYVLQEYNHIQSSKVHLPQSTMLCVSSRAHVL